MCAFKKVKQVYELLQDEQSKAIFVNRFLGLLTGEAQYWNKLSDGYGSEIVRRIGHCEHPKDDFFGHYVREYLKDNRQIVIYGIGDWGKRLIQNLPPESPVIICDKKAEKGMSEYHGFPVITKDKLLTDYSGCDIIIASSAWCSEIENDLLQSGVKRERIKCLCENSHVNECDNNQQYFEDKLMIPGNDEVFIDAGVYDGGSSLRFARWCNGNYKKIIGFEPSKENLLLCSQSEEFSKLKNLTIYNKGLWDKEETLKFAIANGTDSSISDSGTEMVETVALDGILKGEPATFIKMDIEGAELKALQGARETILRYKPRLAVCIYHKPEDLIELPAYIHELVPEYKFYLRHYSTYSQETVLYAIA